MSHLETSTEKENEQTVLELQNTLSDSRRAQWQDIISKYSQSVDDESINFDNLAKEFEENNGSDESMDCTDSSGSDDEEEVIPKNKSILEMNQRWVNICKQMDTTGVCNVCSTILTSCSKSVVEDNTFIKENPNESNIESGSSSSFKSTSSSKPSTSRASSSPKASTSKDSSSPNASTSKASSSPKASSSTASNSSRDSNCDDLIHEDDTELMVHYVRETKCEFSATELNAIKHTIESKVGDALKEVGFRLNSSECAEDHELRRKVKQELINLLEILVVDVSIKGLCVYGEFESWKLDYMF